MVKVPSPNWPQSLLPQHCTVPSSAIAQALPPSAASRIRRGRAPFSPLDRAVPNAPVLRGNLGAAIRLWALPALPVAWPEQAEWVFSYQTARRLPPGLRAGRIYPVGPRIYLVKVAR